MLSIFAFKKLAEFCDYLLFRGLLIALIVKYRKMLFCFMYAREIIEYIMGV